MGHGVFQAFHRLRGCLVVAAPGLVPQPFPDLVERVGHPGDDVERVEHALGVRQVLLHAGVDPFGAVAGGRLDGGALLVGQLSEEQVEDLLAVPVVRPDDPFALVVDDHGDVRAPLPVAGLSTPIAVRPSNMHGGGSQAGGDPARDVTGGPPLDA